MVSDKIGYLVHLIFLQEMNIATMRWRTLSLKTNLRKFDYAKLMKRWRKDWPECDHRMLQDLKEKWPEGRVCKSLYVFCNCISSTLPPFLSWQLNRPFPTDVCIWMAYCCQ